MDGVSAFVTGLWQFFTGLAAGIAGIIAMSVSLVLYFSEKHVRLSVPILAVLGTLLLLPAGLMFGTYLVSLGIVTGIIITVLTALIIFYDIIVIRKYIIQKKTKSMEEQNG
ncbi:MAG: hypothetical protein IK990_20630 [Ruminiclostridium sp.]|nr:hypothetical protein [Ruminiclostridium sp.]